jgi:hypothetical protein
MEKDDAPRYGEFIDPAITVIETGAAIHSSLRDRYIGFLTRQEEFFNQELTVVVPPIYHLARAAVKATVGALKRHAEREQIQIIS